MKNTTNIEYLLLIKSAMQFREDLTNLSKIIDSLSKEKCIIVANYICSIKEKIECIENALDEKCLDGSED